MDTIVNILQKAPTYDLLSLAEMKVALNISDLDTSQDALIATQITQMSDIIQTLCHRVFAREEVIETIRELDSRRVYLSHWPTYPDDIETVECPRGTPYDPLGWELEVDSGKLELFNGQDEPITVKYWGGFVLPDEAPPALKAACEILVRTYRIWNQRQVTSGIRSISHKDARVMFFDPNTLLAKTMGKGAELPSSVTALLSQFTRIEA